MVNVRLPGIDLRREIMAQNKIRIEYTLTVVASVPNTVVASVPKLVVDQFGRASVLN